MSMKVYAMPPFCVAGRWSLPARVLGACDELLSDIGIQEANRGIGPHEAFRMHLKRYEIYEEVRRRDTGMSGTFIAMSPDKRGDCETTMKNAEVFATLAPKRWKKLVAWQKQWPWSAEEFRQFYKAMEKLGYSGVAIPVRYMPSRNGNIICAKEVATCLKAVHRALEVAGDGWIHLLGAPKALLLSIRF